MIKSKKKLALEIHTVRQLDGLAAVTGGLRNPTVSLCRTECLSNGSAAKPCGG